jgi:nucleoside-diphosphate-sugar epimerase
VRVFVAGGSGAIGRVLIPRLVAAGHIVAATTRTQNKVGLIESLGATPVLLDALDEVSVTAVLESFRPDALMNQLTSLPQHYSPRQMGPWFDATNKLRVDGTRILIAAAAKVGARRLVYQSIAFIYKTMGPLVVEENAPVAFDAPEPFGGAVRATVEGERLAMATDGITGVALRYGQLYGPGTYFAAGGDFQRQARARMLPIVGSGAGIFSFLHVDDAATAAIAALERGQGVYNITDDEPAAARDWIPAFCRDVGAPPPFRVPAFVARMIAGSFATSALTEGRGASNRKAKSEMGWTPSHPTWRAGFVSGGVRS